MKEISPAGGVRLINSGPVIVVTCGPVDSPNAITLAWSMVVSRQPPLVAVAVALRHFSHDLILDGGAFVINVPNKSHIQAVVTCGTRSGSDGDKFAPAGITPVKAEKVPTVYIKEFPGRLECVLFKSQIAGDHRLFIGEVKAAYADEEAFGDHWLTSCEKAHLLHHLGGPNFAVADNTITARSGK